MSAAHISHFVRASAQGTALFVAAAVMPLSVLAQSATDPASVYCAPGRAPVCVALALSTAPALDGGTAAVVRLRNLEGTTETIANLPSGRAAWTRVYGIQIRPRAGGSFGGTTDVSAIALEPGPGAEAKGDITHTWALDPILAEIGTFDGYELYADPAAGGADVIGCTRPPDAGWPYVRTCGTASDATPELALRFVTGGQWGASDVTIAILFGDPLGEEACNLVASSDGTEAEYSCVRLGGAAAPSKAAATLVFGPLTATYDGTPKPVSVTTVPAGLAGVTVWYGAGLVPPIDAGIYAVRAALTSDTHVATPIEATLSIAPAPQSLAWKTAPPTSGLVGDEIAVAATGGLSSAPVTIASRTPSACAVLERGSGAASVTLLAVGPCVLEVTQPGTANYLPATPLVATIGIRWPFEGFFAPVANPPADNVAKAGSAIPLKFGLGGDRGLAILDGAPQVQSIACGTGTPGEALESAAAESRSELTYDAANQRYSFVWKTQAEWADHCMELALRLVDGSTHRAVVRFRP